VVENVTAELVQACLSPAEEQVSNIDTLNVTSLENGEQLRFDQELEIVGQVATGFINDLQACVGERVMDDSATTTLQAKAAIGGCFEFKDAVIESLVLTSADDPTTEEPTSAAPNGTPVSLAPSGPSGQTKSPSNSDTDAPTLAPGSSTKSSKASGKTSKTNSSTSTKSANKSDNKSKASSKASSKSSKKSIKVEGEESKETTSVINESAKVEDEEHTEAIEETTKDKEEVKSFMGVILEVVGNMLSGWGR
jgi:hypothetical protein